MKRFFFHIDYGETFRDTEGTLLPDLRFARRNAAELLGRMLIDESDSFWSKPNIVVTVTDDSDLVLWSIETIALGSAAVSQTS